MDRPRPARALRVAVLTVVTGLATACAGGMVPPSTSAPPSPAPANSPASASGSPHLGPSSPSPSPPATNPAAKPSCTQRAGDLSRADQVGQLLMIGVGSTQLTRAEAETLADVRAGSAILLGNSSRGVPGTRQVSDDVRQAYPGPTEIRPLVAADQEGGLVQRLTGNGFATMPSATVQARQSDRTLARNAARWGAELRKAGIDANLAPVADLVPSAMTSSNAPIGQLRRGYGSSPTTVAAKVVAFDRGMGAAGVATAVKHFPGIGRVRGNTDFATRVVDSTTTRNDPALAGFDAAIKADIDMVMVSSAYYSRIDAKRRAAFSPVVINAMLRQDRGFTGVVISDDLSAAALRDLSPGERALRFVSAGGDLAIVGDPSEARATAAALTARAKQDDTFAARVTESAGRVLALKASHGLADCRSS